MANKRKRDGHENHQEHQNNTLNYTNQSTANNGNHPKNTSNGYNFGGSGESYGSDSTNTHRGEGRSHSANGYGATNGHIGASSAKLNRKGKKNDRADVATYDIMNMSKGNIPSSALKGTFATNSIVQADYHGAGNVPIPDAEDVLLAKNAVDRNHK